MTPITADSPPRLLLLDVEELLALRRRVYDGDPDLQRADEQLLENAEQATQAGPFSVAHKKRMPPSGDVHDYLSEAPYWWPDPDSTDGLPYVRRDGEINPEREDRDPSELAGLMAAVSTLSLGYFYTEQERFADHAARLLRTWFLDPATSMNPHLEFGQAIPGRAEGRAEGIIETRQLCQLPDASGLLEASSSWSDEDDGQLRAWCAEFASWLNTSRHGLGECERTDNHGTWYDAQVIALSLFVGDDDTAAEAVKRLPRRIQAQIAEDGSQPQELARTRSLDYCLMNLTGLLDLTELCARCGPMFDALVSEVRPGMAAAVAWLVDNAVDSEWIHPQITEIDRRQLIPLLTRGSHLLGDPSLRERASRLDADAAADRSHLLYA
ncbi:MAG: alginate lyase family protein [Candidatus Latescibacterota bacterium]|nr:alginate lyase family protein [Candidatus Latescibacterota bacterium]